MSLPSIERPTPPPGTRIMEPAEVLAYAARLHADGKRVEADQAYRHVLTHAPETLAALNGLAILCAEAGNLAEAEELLEEAIGLAPDNAELSSNLGRILLTAGQAEAALARFDRAAVLAPTVAQPHFNRGCALEALGRGAEAEVAFRDALARDPNMAPAHYRLALIALAAGDTDRAREGLRRVLAIVPAHGDALLVLGRLEIANGQFDEGARQLDAAVVAGRETAELQNEIGVALCNAERYEHALPHFSRAATLQPSLVAAHNNAGNALTALKRYGRAVDAYRNAIAIDPDDPDLHGNLAFALTEASRAEEALPHLDRAIAGDPDRAHYHAMRARAQILVGDLADAEASFARAVALEPDNPAFHAGIALNRPLKADDPSFLALRGMADTIDRYDDGDRQLLHFGLHRAYEAQRKLDTAIHHLIEGNRLRRATIPYDEGPALQQLERIAQVFDADLMRRARDPGETPDMPIFIIGMPRSGTTLLEQILSSHPSVFGAGEVPYMARAIATLGPVGSAFPDNIPGRSDDEFAEAAARYRSMLRADAGGAARITDKMLGNVRHVGAIRLMLPRARIIHIRRDPVDTCLSCFSQVFGQALPYVNDLGELGRHYRAYDRLMAHWRALMPREAMLEVDYELLIRDFEPHVRHILAFCGLAWDPACIAFHRNPRVVRTASATQVRQPLYRHARGRGRRYGDALRPLIDALGPLADRVPGKA